MIFWPRQRRWFFRGAQATRLRSPRAQLTFNYPLLARAGCAAPWSEATRAFSARASGQRSVHLAGREACSHFLDAPSSLRDFLASIFESPYVVSYRFRFLHGIRTARSVSLPGAAARAPIKQVRDARLQRTHPKFSRHRPPFQTAHSKSNPERSTVRIAPH